MSAQGYALSRSQVECFDRGVTQVTVARPGVVALDTAEALATAGARWEILRTTFPVAPGAVHPVQLVAASPPAAGTPARSATDLTSLPLVEVVVDGSALRLSAPSVVADHRSLDLLASYLVGALPMPEDPLQYADIAGWEDEQRATDGPERRGAIAFWAASSDADTTTAPAGEPGEASLAVERDVVFGGWLAAWVNVLGRNGLRAAADPTPDLAVTVSGRGAAELTDAIGPLARWVPLRLPVEPSATFESASVAAEAVLGRAERYAVHAPTVTVARAGVSFHPATAVRPAPHPGLDLELQVVGARAARVVARTAAPAARLATHLQRLLTAVSADPSSVLDDVPLLDDADLDALATAGDGGPATVPDGVSSLVDGLARQVAIRPDALAVADATTRLTFAELDARTAAVARGLRSTTGTAAGAAVAVVVDRTVDTVVAMVGVLRAGACFQPVDPASPPSRLDAQLRQGRCRLVVAPVGWAATDLDVTSVAALERMAPRAQTAEGLPTVPPEAVAYQMSTSGTTGTPKVVAVTHRNAVAYASGVSARLGLGAHDRLGVVTSLATDLAYTMVFPAFVVGAGVRVFDETEIGELAPLAAAVARDGVTAIKTTPSHLRALGADTTTTLTVPLLVLGGESLDAATVAVARARGARRVVNHYGPTETTVGATTSDVTDLGDPSDGPLPIGTALPGVRTHVLDERLRPVPWGVPGRLAVSGSGVSAGYVGDPDTTTNRFVEWVGPAGSSERVYLTGDVVELDDHGRLRFLGRDDDQVKIRGFRVELGEIAAALRAHPAVVDAVAVVDPDDVERDRVLAYVVTVPGVEPSEAELTAWSGDRLPSYAVPRRTVALPALPLTASGKIDRRALPRVDGPVETAVVAPEGDVETRLHAIWADVLEIDWLGVDDDFFLVGGHSLLATRITARARTEFGIELPLHLMFSHTTVRDLAAEIEARLGAAGGAADDADVADLLATLDRMSEAEAEALLAQHPTADDRTS